MHRYKFTMISAFALVIGALAGCENAPRQNTTTGQTLAGLTDDDHDGVPDLLEIAQCGPAAALKITVYPGASELCDGVDNNCDAQHLIDEGCADLDGDGVVDNLDDDMDGDHSPNATDCDPLDPSTGKGVAELCDGKDNNCDGTTDEAGVSGCTQYYLDADSDTFGQSNMTMCTCAPIGAYTATQAGDCNDDDGATYPGASELCDGIDRNCDGQFDEGFLDTDGDNIADCVDTDDDNDGFLDGQDNCSLIANADQANVDNDSFGDVCDADIDNDDIDNGADNCPSVSNFDQTDTDTDGLGDVCDADKDGDGVSNASDNCPLLANADQLNTDGDDLGDVCDADKDGDGIDDALDNCPLIANADQANTDASALNGDLLGDACDDDDDADSDPDLTDCQPLDWQINQFALDVCDGKDNNCNGQIDEGSPDLDGDGVADCVDSDTDGDLDPNSTDCAPLDPAIRHGVLHDECDGVDNDCDTAVDESPLTTGAIYYLDPDGDGYAKAGADSVRLCVPDVVNHYTATQLGDCSEGDKFTHPGAVDVCGNDLDEDCSGADSICPIACVNNGQCADVNPCTTDTCELGACVHTNNTLSCDDGSACTTGDVCGAGTCAGTAVVCQYGTCNPTTGQCDCTPQCAGKQCGDNGCGGVCGSCDDQNTCTTDSCTVASQCQHDPLPAGTCCGLEPVMTDIGTTKCEFYDAGGALLRTVTNPGLGMVSGQVGECGVYCAGSYFTCAGDAGGGFSHAATLTCGWDGAHFPNTP